MQKKLVQQNGHFRPTGTFSEILKGHLKLKIFLRNGNYIIFRVKFVFKTLKYTDPFRIKKPY
jgi:hypothetical protein